MNILLNYVYVPLYLVFINAILHFYVQRNDRLILITDLKLITILFDVGLRCKTFSMNIKNNFFFFENNIKMYQRVKVWCCHGFVTKYVYNAF